MNKKLLSVILSAVILLGLFTLANVYAEEEYIVNSFERTATGYGLISAADHEYSSPEEWSANKILYKRASEVAGDPVETKDNLIFFKFDVSNFATADYDFIDKAELSFYFTGKRDQDLRIYPVANDTWEYNTLTWNTVYGREADAENGIEAIEASYLPESDYVSYDLARTSSNKSAKLFTIDITEIIKKGYAEDGFLSFAMGTYTQAEYPGQYFIDAFTSQFSYGKPTLTFKQIKPAFDFPAGEHTVQYADHGFIRPSAPGTVHDLIASGVRYEPINSDLSDPYGADDAVYLKFDLSSIQGEIEKAELKLNLGSVRSWTNRIYPVENDNWTHQTLTFNTAYGTEGVEADPEQGIEGVEAQEALYAPENSGYVEFKNIRTEASSSPEINTIDVTELVKSLTENDRIVSMAFMPVTTTSARPVYFYVKGASPASLVVTTKAATVTPENIQFKIDGNNADNITGDSGVVTAEINVHSDMPGATRATMIMAHYEGDRLVKIYTSPQQVIGNKDTNGGNSTLTISSGEVITFTENTKIKAFAWKHFRVQQPLGASETISAQ